MADGKPQGSSEQFAGAGILFVILGAFGYLFWWVWSDQIGSFIRWIRFGEMWMISHFLPDNYIIEWRGFKVNFDEWLRSTPLLPPDKIDGKMINLLTTL